LLFFVALSVQLNFFASSKPLVQADIGYNNHQSDPSSSVKSDLASQNAAMIAAG
jgi:hypothetical protein